MVSCNSKCVAPIKEQAHCSVCHVTFETVRLFDQHRKLSGYKCA